jgi:hypothetical protein
MNNLFDEIMEKCNHKKVVGLCKKLTKNLSFNSINDCKNLCDLAFWLYVFNYTQLAMECIKLTYDFPEDTGIWSWGFIDMMWGLEIRILRLEGKNDDAEKIVQKIKELNISLLKKGVNEKFTFEILENRDKRRRERFVFKGVSQQHQIEVSKQNQINGQLELNHIQRANDWRFNGLMELIGYTETGLFPNLNKEKEKIEEAIKIYEEEILKVTSKK